MAKELVLRVAEARQRDIGRGKVRISDANMRAIGITTGDVVEIIGKKTTAAIAWPAYVKDQGSELIRMDGIIRRNAQVSLEDKLTIRRADVKVARNVVLAPTEYVPLDFGFEVFVKRKLLGYPVTAHDTVLIPILGRALPFVVNSTSPPDSVTLITDTTRLKVSEKPISELDAIGRDRISYEDIGGLGDAILRIREMVELPLKHPELFLKLGIDPPKGVLLHGPPGTGKTLLAKAVANESEAHFIPIQGPEVMSKFYGECIAGDSLVFMNGSGLKSISETIKEDSAHSIAGLNFETGEIDFLPIKEKFDKGVQETLRIIVPHGRIEVTPPSRLLTLHDGKPTWTFADELTIGDQIASADSMDKIRESFSFNHESRSEKLGQESETAWTSPSDRIPIAQWVYKIGKEAELTQKELIQHGINPAARELTRQQLQKAHGMLKEKGIDQAFLDVMQKLLKMKVIWTPIQKIEKSQAHVFDFEVPKHHNYIANGIIVHNSEARLREIFKEAEENAPSIIFIDEIDAIAPKREEVTGEVERRVVAQILALMDGLQSRGEVIVIGASNRPNALDSALRRPGRFDREIEIGVPDKNERFEILQIHTRRMPGIDEVDLEQLATITHGFVGADLAALAREAAMKALREHLPNIDLEAETIPADVLEALKVETRHFESALKEIQPSAIREVFLEIPTVKWSDIGGLEEPKQELIETVEWPLRDREAFERIGIEPPRGILLYGPPGCGKTLLAKAVANESKANFISIKGPELISKWVGESEKAIREVFRKSRLSAPAIVFFDEIDSIAHRRGGGDSTLVNERVMSQLLTELDGLEPLRDIVVLGATNRPDIIDSALLRPGRFDRLIPIPAPDEETRRKILELHLNRMELDEDVDIDRLVDSTKSFAGADIEGLCREAGMMALRENLKTKTVKQKHFEIALKKVHGSLTEEILRWFEDLEKKLRRRGAGLKTATAPIFG